MSARYSDQCRSMRWARCAPKAPGRGRAAQRRRRSGWSEASALPQLTSGSALRRMRRPPLGAGLRTAAASSSVSASARTTRSQSHASVTSSRSCVSTDLSTSSPAASTRARTAGLADEWIIRRRTEELSGQNEKSTRGRTGAASPAGKRRIAKEGSPSGRSRSAAAREAAEPSASSATSSICSLCTASTRPPVPAFAKDSTAALAPSVGGKPTAAPVTPRPPMSAMPRAPVARSAAAARCSSWAWRSSSVSASAFIFGVRLCGLLSAAPSARLVSCTSAEGVWPWYSFRRESSSTIAAALSSPASVT
mmetsp:Transcript_12695/g.33992  ORF Transcript_12695/g.33992 Transcript_12695/m.33992 type:complete len:307 (-) Transcript_12695:443-1363(-)